MKRLLSFPVALAFGLAVVMCLTCRSRFQDPDTWWHLKVGQTIWESRSLPRSDQLSYTTGNHAWTPHEWLAEVSIYAAYKAAGYQGLALWLASLAVLVAVGVYALCCLYSGNAKVALLGGLVAWFFSSVGLAIRPHLIGYVLLVLELLALHLGARNPRWLWALPPLFGLWVNCHGSWVLGLIVLGVFVIAGPDRRRLGLALALSAAALFLNPVGPRLLAYPFDVMFHQSDNLASVSEWRPLDVHEPRGMGMLLVAGSILALSLIRRRPLRFPEAALLLVGAGMAFRHTRMLFAFGILAAPVLCRMLADAWENYEPARDNLRANTLLITASVLVILAAFPSAAHLDRQVKDANPGAAVEFLRRSGIEGRMLNEYVWGGYLIWASPERKVFIDGRTDIFDWTGVLADYGRWYTVQEDPQLLLSRYGVDYCLLRAGAPMASVLPYLPGWRRVYGDPAAVVFAKDRHAAQVSQGDEDPRKGVVVGIEVGPGQQQQAAQRAVGGQGGRHGQQ